MENGQFCIITSRAPSLKHKRGFDRCGHVGESEQFSAVKVSNVDDRLNSNFNYSRASYAIFHS